VWGGGLFHAEPNNRRKDMSRYKVRLDVFRGADASPLCVRHVRVLAQSALDAICRAEQGLNTKLPDDQYAAASAVWPVARHPAISMPLPLPIAA
jgi:hypothetical protein